MEPKTIDEGKKFGIKDNTQQQTSNGAEPKTIDDLNDDCLWHLFDFLNFKDSMSVAIASTRLHSFACKALPIKHKIITIDIVEIGFYSLENETPTAVDTYRRIIQCASGFSDISIDFFNESVNFPWIETIFRLLCEFRTDPINKLALQHFILRGAMPTSMTQFFRTVPVKELTLSYYSCFDDYVVLPNVSSFNLIRCTRINGRIDLRKLKMPDIELFSFHASSCDGLEGFLRNHPNIKEIKFRGVKNYHEWPLPLIINMPQIEHLGLQCEDYEWRDINIQPHQLQNLKKLSLPVSGNFPRSLLNFFKKTKSLECISLLEPFDVEQYDLIFQEIAKIKCLRKVEFHEVRFIIFPEMEHYIFELIDKSRTLQEIEFDFIHSDLFEGPEIRNERCWHKILNLKSFFQRLEEPGVKSRRLKILLKIYSRPSSMEATFAKLGVSGQYIRDHVRVEFKAPYRHSIRIIV